MRVMEAMDEVQSESRREQRTNMFVLATLASGQAFGSVKIRNMSSGGAMVEGAALPPAGALVELTRGTSSVRGRIAWSISGRAGVRFAGHVDVSEWTPGGNKGQERVDRVVQQVRAGVVPLGADERSVSQGLGALNLAKLARAIDSLADSLADDPMTVARFGTKLQTLDLASQVLRKLSRSVG